MAKKPQEDPPAGLAPWLATFGDLMNLLLCFFVLLFSMSSVDAQKFEAVAASFSQTFSIFQAGATAIGDGLLISNGVSQLNELDAYINSTGRQADYDEQASDYKEQLEQEQLDASEQLAEQIQEALEESDMDKEVDIDFTSQYVMLTLNGALLFDSGSAALKEDSSQVMSKIGEILTRYAESVIEVGGHTDNIPIHNANFSNNDELSSFRALAVFDYLVENTDLNPANIKHSGRGEYVPIADNGTEEGRAKNRRVEIKIYNSLSTY